MVCCFDYKEISMQLAVFRAVRRFVVNEREFILYCFIFIQISFFQEVPNA
jgi:hypothetical protein